MTCLPCKNFSMRESKIRGFGHCKYDPKWRYTSPYCPSCGKYEDSGDGAARLAYLESRK